jgi:nitrogen regulatory protein P-II 2
MKLIQFKLLTIICEPVLSSKILSLSEELGATGFTITEVKGQGSGEKSSGEIPDLKIKIEIVVDSELANRLMQTLATTYFENYSVITYVLDASVMRPEKFESLKS